MIARFSVFLAVLLLLIGAGCSGGSGSGKDSSAPVRLALDRVPAPELGGFHAARETGAFRSSVNLPELVSIDQRPAAQDPTCSPSPD